MQESAETEQKQGVLTHCLNFTMCMCFFHNHTNYK